MKDVLHFCRLHLIEEAVLVHTSLHRWKRVGKLLYPCPFVQCCEDMFSDRVSISSRPPAALPRQCGPSLPDTYLHPIAPPTLQVASVSPDSDADLRPIVPPTLKVSNHSAELSCPDTYLHPIAPPAMKENNQSFNSACPDTHQRSIAPPTPEENCQSVELPCSDTYLHPIAPPTLKANNRSFDSACPDTHLRSISPPTPEENSQSAELSCSDTYLHLIAQHTPDEKSQLDDRLDLDEDGYLRPTDHPQWQLVRQTKLKKKKSSEL